MMKIAVVGATGPTGIHLVTELRKTVASVRVIARSADRLARLFPETAVEKWPADVLDADAILRAIEGCDLVYDCIGLPGDQMQLHPVTAWNIANALRHTKARCVQVSSYWAYYPQVRAEMNESHPRLGGPPWVRYRREAEDVLCATGAAILHLPDFYGTATIAGAISMLAQFAMFFRGGNRDSNSGLGIVGSVLMLILAPLAAMIVQMAISRTREYAADNLGARISGRPDALASALVKISRIAEEVPNDTAETHPATAPLFIINPLSGRGMDNLFSTHPSTENRIAALNKLSREMGLGGFGAPEPAVGTRSRGPWG